MESLKEDENKSIDFKLGGISRAAKRIHLSAEVKALLVRIGGTIVVEFDPQNDTPKFRVVDNEGRNLISLAEFEAIGTYRRFIAEAVKDIERDSTRSERVKKTARLMTLAAGAGVQIPEKILEGNSSKNVELNMNLKVLLENKAKVRALGDDEYKEYILENMDIIEAIFIRELFETMGSTKVTKEARKVLLFGLGVPNWMYGKCISKDWIRDETAEARDLLFMRNNFLKSVSLTIAELRDRDFTSLNEVVVRHSLATIAIFESELVNLVPHTHGDANISEQLTKVFEEYPVVMHDGDVEKVFQPREAGKGHPSITILKQKAGGGKSSTNKEGELPRLRRELLNWLHKLSQTWETLTRGIVLVEDSINQFWGHLYVQAPQWDLSPSKNLFEWIREVDNDLTEFQKIVNLNDHDVRMRLYIGLAAKLELIDEDLINRFVTHMEQQIGATGSHYTARRNVIRGAFPTNVRSNDLEDLSGTTENHRNAAKAFLNFKDKTKKKMKNRANKILLGKDVTDLLNELSTLKNGKELGEAITDWMAKTFTTATGKVRLVVAELVVAAAISDEILVGEDQDEDSDSGDE